MKRNLIEKTYAVILAGGYGERFWPLSTTKTPKQFISLLDKKPLIEITYNRIKSFLPPERIIVITSQDYVALVRKILRELPDENIVGEPSRRDTAPACALALAVVSARQQDSVICMFPSDHIIRDVSKFKAVITAGVEVASQEDVLVTIGIKPTYPSTGLGYIEAGEFYCNKHGVTFQKVKRFVEKPDAKRAEKFIRTGRFYWNAGMFIWSASSIKKALSIHCPDFIRMVENLVVCWNKRGFQTVLGKSYKQIPRISIDYAVMEKARNIVTAKATFDWDDVGSWKALERHLKKDRDGNISIGDCVYMDGCNNLVISEGRFTALLGVDNLVVVHSDSSTLICSKDKEQELKKLLEKIKEKGRREIL
jgi:mannose-1-phosphate guanylyltransferase